MVYAVIQAKGWEEIKLLARDKEALNSFILAYNLETKTKHEIQFVDDNMGTIVILPEDFNY